MTYETFIHNPAATFAPRREHDFYPTPIELCRAAVRLIPYGRIESVLDPGAGTGVWGVAVSEMWPNAHVVGIELRDDAPIPAPYAEWQRDDFLKTQNEHCFDLVIGNPPYKLAEQFIRKSLAQSNGCVLFLLRLAFLESQSRGVGLWRECPPMEVHVLSRRPSFMPEGSGKEGKTDSTAYALFLWRKGWKGTTSLKWLNW